LVKPILPEKTPKYFFSFFDSEFSFDFPKELLKVRNIIKDIYIQRKRKREECKF